MTTIGKIVEFFGGDALDSMDASEPRPHDQRYTVCRVGLGRGRGVLGLLLCPHASCGGTSADDGGSFVMVFKHKGYFFE